MVVVEVMIRQHKLYLPMLQDKKQAKATAHSDSADCILGHHFALIPAPKRSHRDTNSTSGLPSSLPMWALGYRSKCKEMTKYAVRVNCQRCHSEYQCLLHIS